MPLIFQGQDSQFAVSTGANVNSSPNKSDFDTPPASSTGLTVEALEGDPDPRLFEVGDAYVVSWDAPEATVLSDAVVVRSDPSGPGGVIVFEGHDENGDLAHAIWTPDFDLVQWHSANTTEAGPPNFHNTDQNVNYSHTFVCFAAGTLIATARGVRAVETLRPGDGICTLDAGNRPLRWIGRRDLPARGANAPIRFAPGAVGNRRALCLSPQHRVLRRSALAELWHGAPEVLLPARARLGQPGVSRAPMARVSYVHLLLERHAILFAEGALCESLLLGAESAKILASAPLAADAAGWSRRPARPLLNLREGRAVLAQEACAARPLRAAPSPV